MAHTVVIADDVTGANDIGIMYAKAGLDTLVYSYGDGKEQKYKECDVLIIDTDSRFDTRENAYRKVFDAIGHIEVGAKQYVDKQCSVFRGNIGAEFDAMLDALNEEFAVVVLGFPDNGRTTIHSNHYVFGTLLEESQFRHDPVHPMVCSDLREILRSQTKRPVGAIYWELYEKGEQVVRDTLEHKRIKGGYCIMDVRDNRDLAFLADILKDEKIICGSSALSAYLAKAHTSLENTFVRCKDNDTNGKVLCIAGSLTPQTIGQTAYMSEQKYPVFKLDTRKLLSDHKYKQECERLMDAVAKAYETGEFAMVHSMQEHKLVEETKRLAAESGMENKQVSMLVSRALSEIGEKIIKCCGIRKIIVCGGDTSAALCSRLEIGGMRVLEEIETGLPTCQCVDAPYYHLVLKSGSFGSGEFIEKALHNLKGGSGKCL